MEAAIANLDCGVRCVWDETDDPLVWSILYCVYDVASLSESDENVSHPDSN